MNFESNIFKRLIPDYDRLLSYGFILNGKKYEYVTKIIDGDFEVCIVVFDGKVSGKIYDLDINEEYTNFRVDGQNGVFVNRVREEYTNILIDIASKCFIKRPFISEQANRICNLMLDKYGDEPIFKFDGYPGFGIFENNGKWYALIMNLEKGKLDGKSKDEIEIINLKLDKNKINSLLKKKGFYKAYHMNKINWISVILDDTIDDDILMELIDESRSYTVISKQSKNEWVIPANPKYFDFERAFLENKVITWHRGANIQANDIIYIYMTKPYSAIIYKCVVLETNVYGESDLMNMKLIETYSPLKFPMEKLRKFGLTSIRGARHIPEALSKEMNL